MNECFSKFSGHALRLAQPTLLKIGCFSPVVVDNPWTLKPASIRDRVPVREAGIVVFGGKFEASRKTALALADTCEGKMGKAHKHDIWSFTRNWVEPTEQRNRKTVLARKKERIEQARRTSKRRRINVNFHAHYGRKWNF